jgi:hypothetical protein
MAVGDYLGNRTLNPVDRPTRNIFNLGFGKIPAAIAAPDYTGPTIPSDNQISEEEKARLQQEAEAQASANASRIQSILHRANAFQRQANINPARGDLLYPSVPVTATVNTGPTPEASQQQLSAIQQWANNLTKGSYNAIAAFRRPGIGSGIGLNTTSDSIAARSKITPETFNIPENNSWIQRQRNLDVANFVKENSQKPEYIKNPQKLFNEATARLLGSRSVFSTTPYSIPKSEWNPSVTSGNFDGMGSNNPNYPGALVLRKWNVPFTADGRTATDVTNAQYTEVENLYKAIYGSAYVPAYSSQVYTGATATFLRAAISAQATDQTLSEDFLNTAKSIKTFEDLGINPYTDPTFVEKLKQAEIIHNAHIQGLGEEQIRVAIEQQQAEDKYAAQKREMDNPSGLGGFLKRVISNPVTQWGIIKPLQFFGLPYEKLVLTPYYTYRMARISGKSESDSISAGLSAAILDNPLSSWIGNAAINTPGFSQRQRGEMASQIHSYQQLVDSIDTESKREKLGLRSLGQDIAFQLSLLNTGTGNYNASLGSIGFKSLDPFTLGTNSNGIPISGAVDGVARLALDPMQWFLIGSGSAAKVVENATKEALAEAAAIRISAIADEGISAAESLSDAANAAAAARDEAFKVTNFLNRYGTADRTPADVALENAVNARLANEAEVAAKTLENAQKIADGGKYAKSIAKFKSRLNPSYILTDAERASITESTLANFAETSIGKSYLSYVGDSISKFGNSIVQLQKVLKDVPESVVDSIVSAVDSGGLEAGVNAFKEAFTTGIIRPKITIRRQLATEIADMLAQKFGVVGEVGISKGFAGGRGVPLLLGKSPVKPSTFSFINKLEQMAGRFNAYNEILGNNIFDYVNVIAKRVSNSEGLFVQDYFKENLDEFFRAENYTSIPERVDRLLSIAQASETTLYGFNDVILQTISKFEELNPEQADKVLRELEVIVDIAISGSQESQDLTRFLVARLADGTTLKTPITTAYRNVLLTNKVISKSRITIQEIREVDAAILADESIPSSVKKELTFVSSRNRNVLNNFNKAVKTLENATKKLAKLAVEASGLEERLAILRAEGIQNLKNAVEVVQNLAERRSTLRSLYVAERKQITEELNFGMELIREERASLIARRDALLEIEITAENREVVNAELKDVRSKIKDNSDFRKTFTEEIQTKRKNALDSYTKASTDPSFVALEQQAAENVRIARAEYVSKAFIKEELENAVNRTVQEAGNGPIERYVAMNEINPDEIFDDLVREVVLQHKELQFIDEQTTDFVDRAMWGLDVRQGRNLFPVGPESDYWKEFSDAEILTMSQANNPISGKVLNVPHSTEGAIGRDILWERMFRLPAVLKDYFRNRIAEAVVAGDTELTAIASDVEHLISNPTMANAVSEELIRQSNLAKYIESTFTNEQVKLGIASRAKAAVAKLALSNIESVAPRVIRFVSHANPILSIRNRVSDMDRWMADLGFNLETRAEASYIVASIKNQAEMYEFIKEVQTAWAVNMDINPVALVKAQERAWKESAVAFLADNPEVRTTIFGNEKLVNAEVLKGVATEQQLGRNISVKSADDMRHIARQEIANSLTGVESRINNLQVGIRDLSKTKYGSFLKGMHTFWKFSVVLNAPSVAFGAAAGLIYGDPQKNNSNWGDRFRMAAIGGLIGSLGGVRHILRVPFLEERIIRYSLARGLSPQEWIPGISGWWSEFGVELPARDLEELIGNYHAPSSAVDYAGTFEAVSPEWTTVIPSEKNYIDGWARIVNRQINPNTSILTRIILENWEDGPDVWRQLAEEWLNNSAEGRIVRDSLTHSYGGASNVGEILDRHAAMIEQYLPTYELRQLRLGLPENRVIPNSVFQQYVDSGVEGSFPDVVHVQRTWKFPKNWKEAKLQINQVYGNILLEKPTLALNRTPMAKQIYAQEYRNLRLLGINPETARELSELKSVRLTNQVMSRLSESSRFASKSDIIFPFQRHREQIMKVYSKLILSGPGKAYRLAYLGATAFNAGKTSGIFYQNGNDEWVMRIPGSAWLSRVFGGAPNDGYSLVLKDMFFILHGNAFAASSGSPDFTDNSALALIMGQIPAPGGPIWSFATKAAYATFPEFFDNLQKSSPFIYNRLFPYGIQGTFFRPESTRLWEGITGTTPPWEFFSAADQQESLKSVQISVEQEMIWQHKDDPNYLEYIQSPSGQEEVKKNTSALLMGWATIGALAPAPTRAIMPGKDEFDSVWKTLQGQFGSQAYSKLTELRPDLEIFIQPKTKSKDTEDFQTWIKRIGYDPLAMQHKERTYFTPEEFAKEFKHAKDTSNAYREISEIWNSVYYAPTERYNAIARLNEKYKDSGVDFKNEYFKQKELARILFNTPISQREDELNRWRLHYDVSVKEYASLLKKTGDFKIDIRNEARSYDEISKQVSEWTVGGNPLAAVTRLPLQDQEVWIQTEMSKVGLADTLDADIVKYGKSYAQTKAETAASATVTYWNSLKSSLDTLYANNPVFNLSNDLSAKSANQIYVQDTYNQYKPYLDLIYEKLAEAWTAKDLAIQSGDYSTISALNKQISALYKQKQSILEVLYKKFPNLTALEQDMKTQAFIAENPDSKMAQDSIDRLEKIYAEFGIPSIAFDSEERNYFKMPFAVRQAYKTDLSARLNYKDNQSGKLYWNYLTPFQKDLLEKSPAPNSALEKWKSNPNYTKSGSKSGGSEATDNLNYAYSLMRQYNKRPAGASAPEAYAEYMKIPNSNSGAKRAFLREHPEVVDWIKLGPLSNMPEIDRLQVVNIMVKYGKWQGEMMDDTEIINLAWARTQIKSWSLRKGDAPSTYDIWLNMPSGPDKAVYLEQHPEVQSWISAGPMANMPDSYRAVVRDIMQRYHEWSASTDPLGETLTEFYSIPSYKRQQYLIDHPELKAYWAALRSPEENRLAALSEQYFSIPSSAGRKVFLSAHPDLSAYFVDSRQKRYERFLNQVAVYMGANPDAFDKYLTEQNRILTEFISRFGTTPLIREIKAPSMTSENITTSGRARTKK